MLSPGAVEKLEQSSTGAGTIDVAILPGGAPDGDADESTAAATSPTIPEADHSKTRPVTLVFPDKLYLGDVYTRPAESFGRWEELGKARGEVEIPAGEEVLLSIRLSGISFLAEVPPDAVHTLRLTNPEIGNDDLVHLQHLKGLQYLVLEDTAVTSSGLEELKEVLPSCNFRRKRL